MRERLWLPQRLITVIILALGLAALSACAGKSSAPDGAAPGLEAGGKAGSPLDAAAGGGSAPSLEGLPGLPGTDPQVRPADSAAAEPPARRSSYDQFEFVEGNAIYSASSMTTFIQESAMVVPGPGSPGWAIYSVNTGGYQPSRLELDLRLSENGTAFVALSRYSSGRWDIRGPFTGPASIQVGSGDYLSGAGDSADRRFYFAVLVSNAYVEHRFSTVHFDNAVPPRHPRIGHAD
ncbi:hypothetical protein IT575_07540 [bacterium]|nr:hypothetical protein [bacterium]